jgi:hypothetical protein
MFDWDVSLHKVGEPNECCGEDEAPSVDDGVFVVARGQAAPVFEGD